MMRLRLPLVALVALATGACGLFGPSGPGTLDATVSGPQAVGAVVVEIVGQGITGFVGQGGSRVYGAELPGTSTSKGVAKHRVVVLASTAGSLAFGIKVEDLGADLPVATVLVTANGSNTLVPSGAVKVTVEEP